MLMCLLCPWNLGFSITLVVEVFKYMIEFMTNISIIKIKKINNPKVIMNKLFRTIII
jgi:hypothetical protein